jgi:hypothetical protein
MEYAIVVFFLGVMVTFIVAKGVMLARDEAARYQDTGEKCLSPGRAQPQPSFD